MNVCATAAVPSTDPLSATITSDAPVQVCAVKDVSIAGRTSAASRAAMITLRSTGSPVSSLRSSVAEQT